MASYRITGVVRIMNRVRSQLRTGVLPSQVDDIKNLVRSTIQQVETICRKNKIPAEKLPAPTYRAYEYLKSLDLERLPVSSKSQPVHSAAPGSGSLRLHGLVSFCTNLQASLNGYAQNTGKPPRPGASPAPNRNDLVESIRSMAASVEKLCQEARVSPLDLPTPTRRSYLWLKFLSEPANFDRHLQALETIYRASREAKCAQKTSLGPHLLQVQIEFSNLPVLYRARLEKKVFRLAAHEAYITAPPPILEALVCAALLGASRKAKQAGSFLAKVKDYAQSDDFRRVAALLEHGEPLPSPAAPDQAAVPARSDPRLLELFRKINQEYFGGQIPTPRLVWNQTITHRKLGHYQYNTDTVMLSVTLDNPAVPEYIREFVVYHELLHKKLGMQIKNDRRYAHTREFREEERKFRQYEEASAFLNNLGNALRL